MEIWPNWFILRAPRTGTTSLYWHLKNIPGIYMSSTKEPHYFSDHSISKHDWLLGPIQDKKKYLSLFETVQDEKIIGEASTHYLDDPETPKKIHQIIPNARIIIGLRDPVERAFSHYWNRFSNNWIKLSFHDQLQKEFQYRTDYEDLEIFILKHGLYSDNVKRYFDIFGQKQVKILIFEEFIQNPKTIIEENIKFLGINYSIQNFENIILRMTNNKPKMKQEDRETLIKFYQNDVKKLQAVLGRKLPWPN